MTQGPHEPRYGHPESGPIPPQYYAPPPPPQKSHKVRTFFLVTLIAGLGLVALVSCLAVLNSESTGSPESPETLPPASSTPGPSKSAAPKVKTFMSQDGTYLVPENIEPGTYRNGNEPDCYWARLKDTSGELEDIIVNGTGANQVVTIKKGDRAFQVTRCGAWVLVKP